MIQYTVAAAAILVIGACAASSTALADNPAGFYVGAGVGASNLRNNGYGYDNYYGYNDYGTAWKLIAGVRPLPFLGAELEYIDLGRISNDPNYYYGGYYFNGDHTDSKATTLFGVGYLPLGVPFLDVYGKAGVARLQSSTTSYFSNIGNCGVTCPANAYGAYGRSEWTTNFAYGLGLQTKFLGLALRAEYERISRSGGDPEALTFSATWTF